MIKPLAASLALLLPATFVCDLPAFGTVEASGDDLEDVRKRPPFFGGEAARANSLKHADEQTIAGLAAVFGAIRAFRLDSASLNDWGVLAATRFVGRLAMVQALHRFRAEGAWGVSPHLIPNRSLHSLSGTVSQVLHIQGPNFGVGGGADSEAEVILAAAAFLQDPSLPGVWVIMTGWDPEPVPELKNQLPAPVCRAVALALTRPQAGWNGLRMEVAPGDRSPDNGSPAARFGLETLLAALAADGGDRQCHVWNLGNAGSIRLERTGRGEEVKP